MLSLILFGNYRFVYPALYPLLKALQFAVPVVFP